MSRGHSINIQAVENGFLVTYGRDALTAQTTFTLPRFERVYTTKVELLAWISDHFAEPSPRVPVNATAVAKK